MHPNSSGPDQGSARSNKDPQVRGGKQRKRSSNQEDECVVLSVHHGHIPPSSHAAFTILRFP